MTLALPGTATAGRHDGLDGINATAKQDLASALAAAAGSRRGLAVVQGVWLPGCEAIAALMQMASIESMIGSLQPRFALPDTDQVLTLPGDAPTSERLLRAALSFMPEAVVIPELPAALLVLTSQAVISALEYDSVAFNGELGTLLVSLQRRGFHNLVLNRVVVPFPLNPEHAYPVRSNKDKNNIPDQEDAARMRHSLDQLPERALESILTNAFTSDMRARLLLDCRAVGPSHDHTARVVLGYLDGFDELRPAGIDIAILVSTEAAHFHKLHGRFPAFRLQFDRPDGYFLVAVVLAQPGARSTIVELHAHSVILAFNMLDTIGWDSIPEDLHETWRLMTHFADGLLFESGFTHDRFTFRFPPGPSTKLAIVDRSISSNEVPAASTSPAPLAEQYLLIVGNENRREYVKSILSCIIDAFPFTKIVTRDAGDHMAPQVRVLKNDQLDENEVQAFFAHAAAIIVPSYHNGLRRSIAQALAHGRTFIVRPSQLWEEAANLCDLPGAIVLFDDEVSLVEAIGRALHGLPPRCPKAGRSLALGTEPQKSRDCTRNILDFVSDLAFACDGSHWLTREMGLRQTALIKDQR
ncbi:hypothetical protein MHY1_p00203 (plasmid) [Methylovirgula sp. HY1]|nr:hypothetical protein MHY1_p00203 [Methylovirgula sp. HY1]